MQLVRPRLFLAVGVTRTAKPGLGWAFWPELHAPVLYVVIPFYANSFQGVPLFKNVQGQETYPNMMHKELTEE